VTTKLAAIILEAFNDVSAEDKDLLSATFRAWMDHDGSAPKAASALHCHPNTVRYRLRRIEELSGRSLTAPRQLAELCLAFEVQQRLP
jgi:DNA-binding PucR family transcriptional regulator